jgi:ribokinase
MLDIISPNETELKRITKNHVDTNNKEEILSALELIRNNSNNKKLAMLLKLGRSGSVYIDENNNYYTQQALNFEDMKIVDTTGAGDCFLASFVTQLYEGKPVEYSLLFANAAAYSCITKFGAMPSLPTKDEVLNMLERVQK